MLRQKWQMSFKGEKKVYSHARKNFMMQKIKKLLTWKKEGKEES